MPYRRYARKSKPKSRRVRFAGKRSSRARKSGSRVAKTVRRVLASQNETKYAFYSFPITNFNSTADSTGDICPLIPSIVQGLDQGTRVGDSITCQSLCIRGNINIIPSITDNTRCRIAVRLVVVQPKMFGRFDDIASNLESWLAMVMRIGTGTSVLTGVAPYLTAPLATDMVHVYVDKMFHLNTFYTTGTTGLSTASVAGASRMFKFYVKCKGKKLKYQTSTQGYNASFNPVMLLAYQHLDGSSSDVLTTAVSMQYYCDFRCTDS